MGRRRRGPDDLDGVLVLDKAAGPTSHDVVQQVRRVLRQSRVGHTGTLDPAATGVLVVCLGRATRLVRFLQAGAKTYAARMVLGVTTDTQDADGVVLERRPAGHVDERAVCEVLTRFQGPILQVPPMVSALKVGGTRLHELARRGEEVEREPRPVIVHDLVLDAFEPGEQPVVSFLVTCSAGTYVRTLAHDLGEALGVGGSLVALRRLANGPFTVDEAVPSSQLEEPAAADALRARVLAPATALARALPSVELDDPADARRLTQGGRAAAHGIVGPYALLARGQLLGVYRDEAAGGHARAELVWTRPEELSEELPEELPE